MKQFDMVWVIKLRDDRFKAPNTFNKRKPVVGDKAIIITAPTKKQKHPMYMIECNDENNETIWIDHFFPDEIIPVQDLVPDA